MTDPRPLPPEMKAQLSALGDLARQVARQVADAAPLLVQLVADLGVRQELAQATPVIEWGLRHEDGSYSELPGEAYARSLVALGDPDGETLLLVRRHAARTPWTTVPEAS